MVKHWHPGETFFLNDDEAQDRNFCRISIPLFSSTPLISFFLFFFCGWSIQIMWIQLYRISINTCNERYFLATRKKHDLANGISLFFHGATEPFHRERKRRSADLPSWGKDFLLQSFEKQASSKQVAQKAKEKKNVWCCYRSFSVACWISSVSVGIPVQSFVFLATASLSFFLGRISPSTMPSSTDHLCDVHELSGRLRWNWSKCVLFSHYDEC